MNSEFRISPHASYSELEAQSARRIVKLAKTVGVGVLVGIVSIPFWFMPFLHALALIGVVIGLIALVGAPFWIDWLSKKNKVYQDALRYGVREE